MRKKTVLGLLIGIFLISGMTLGCGKKNVTNNIQEATFDAVAEFTDRDLDASYDEESAVKISLEGDSASVTGENASDSVKVSDGEITILKEGTYLVSGNLTNGTLVVDAADQKVQVVLNGAEISCENFSAFYVENADKVFLTLAEGSENSLADGTEYSFASTDREETDSALFSKDDLTINGTGFLKVTGNFENGITGKDDLKIVSAYITVNAKNHGIKGKDSLLVKDSEISVTAGGDGMKSSNDTDSEKGFVYIESGTFTIEAEEDGIQAETDLKICDGGFVIASKDDGLHSNSLMVIEGGSLEIAAGDDAVHSEAELQILDGSINVTSSYEGLESIVIRIKGGEISLVCRDDGINAAGGALTEGETAGKGGKGPMGGMMESSSGYLYISGGNIMIKAEGDGLDANTDAEMSGGTVVVYGPSNDGNGSLDYGNSFVVTGGTLFTAGSSGMAAAPTDGTTQNTVLAFLDTAGQSGAKVQITDSSDEVLAEFTPTTAFASVIFSDERLKTGETYHLVINGEISETFTQTDTVTYVGTSGGIGGMQQGPGGMKGGQGGGRMTSPDMQDSQRGGQMTPPDGNDRRMEGDTTETL